MSVVQRRSGRTKSTSSPESALGNLSKDGTFPGSYGDSFAGVAPPSKHHTFGSPARRCTIKSTPRACQVYFSRHSTPSKVDISSTAYPHDSIDQPKNPHAESTTYAETFLQSECSSWNIVHNVPTGTLSRFHTASRRRVAQALIWLASPRVPSFAFFCEKWGIWLIAHDKHELVVSVHSAPPPQRRTIKSTSRACQVYFHGDFRLLSNSTNCVPRPKSLADLFASDYGRVIDRGAEKLGKRQRSHPGREYLSLAEREMICAGGRRKLAAAQLRHYQL
jgi:hypothetical protein